MNKKVTLLLIVLLTTIMCQSAEGQIFGRRFQQNTPAFQQQQVVRYRTQPQVRYVPVYQARPAPVYQYNVQRPVQRTIQRPVQTVAQPSTRYQVRTVAVTNNAGCVRYYQYRQPVYQQPIQQTVQLPFPPTFQQPTTVAQIPTVVGEAQGLETQLTGAVQPISEPTTELNQNSILEPMAPIEPIDALEPVEPNKPNETVESNELKLMLEKEPEVAAEPEVPAEPKLSEEPPIIAETEPEPPATLENDPFDLMETENPKEIMEEQVETLKPVDPIIEVEEIEIPDDIFPAPEVETPTAPKEPKRIGVFGGDE